MDMNEMQEPRLNETEAIRNVQRYLRQLSYHDPAIRKVPVDGIFGDDTREALTAFQNGVGLPATGVADRETFDLLFRPSLRSVATYSPPMEFDIFPNEPNNYSVGPGDSQFLVRVIQYLLEEIKVIYDDIGPVPETGVFDTATERAVRQFQLRNELEVTGRVNRYTWDKLNTEHGKYNSPTAQ